jgi:hypothetical protein
VRFFISLFSSVPLKLRHPLANCAIVPFVAQFWVSLWLWLIMAPAFVFNGFAAFSRVGTVRHFYCIERFRVVLTKQF